MSLDRSRAWSSLRAARTAAVVIVLAAIVVLAVALAAFLVLGSR